MRCAELARELHDGDSNEYPLMESAMKIRRVLDIAIVAACSLFVVGPAAARTIAVPEPGTLSVLGLGIGALYLVSRRKRRK